MVTVQRVRAWLRRVRKFLSAAAAAVGVLVANGLLSGAAAAWMTGIIAAAGAGIVYLVPNEQPPAAAAGS